MSVDRRGFLKSLVEPFRLDLHNAGVRSPVNLPYNSDRKLFAVYCPDCEGNCVESCPEEIVGRDEQGIPHLDFRVAGCTFCLKCAEACPHPVLNITNSPDLTGNITIDLMDCIGWNGVVCHTCAMICRDQAVKLQNLLKPRISMDECSRCGLCVRGCPTDAITIFQDGITE